MRLLALAELLELHRRIIVQSSGANGIREFSGILSALAQPSMMFGGEELYPTIESKGAAMCYSLVMNHPFVDGNKRIGHAAMETLLQLNGYELDADVDDAERLMLDLAAGKVTREELTRWITTHIQKLD